MALALVWILAALTPLAALTFLTAFLVNIAKGRHDTAFTRFCDRAQLPAFAVTLVCMVLTLRYF